MFIVGFNPHRTLNSIYTGGWRTGVMRTHIIIGGDIMSRHTERRRKQKKSNYKKSMKEILMSEAYAYFTKYKNDVTRNNYKKHFSEFIDYCRRTYNCKSKAECEQHIQDYADYLAEQGKSASTIHTYIAPVCGYHGVSMSSINKPKRKVSENKRSRTRDNKYNRSDQRYDNDQYKLVADFQSRVGIRKNELKKLTFKNLKKDESGYWCVEVTRGKGGKYHLQRVLPEDIDFIKSYFTTDSKDRLFKSSDFSNHMDYHHLRALQAQQAYWYYYNQLHTGDEKLDAKNAYRMRGELMKRWNKYNLDKKGKSRKFPLNDTKGVYKLRGDNRRKAIADGLPVEYDRLAVYMVSVFHLSHWRLDTLTNYILAV